MKLNLWYSKRMMAWLSVIGFVIFFITLRIRPLIAGFIFLILWRTER